MILPPDIHIPVKFINIGQERALASRERGSGPSKMIYSKGVIEHPWTIKLSALSEPCEKYYQRQPFTAPAQ